MARWHECVRVGVGRWLGWCGGVRVPLRKWAGRGGRWWGARARPEPSSHGHAHEQEAHAEADAEAGRLAAEQGYRQAQLNLGYSYKLGEGVGKNQDTAMKWFWLAAQQDHEDAKRYFH